MASLVNTLSKRSCLTIDQNEQISNLALLLKKHNNKLYLELWKSREVALKEENIFAALMDAVRVASLGQITQTLYEVGGEYRRNV